MTDFITIKDANDQDVKVAVATLQAAVKASLVSGVDPLTGLPEQLGSDAALHVLIYYLRMLNSKLGPLDGAFRMKVLVDAASNAAMNISQWGGQTAASGVGGSGNGAPRVTPSNDTLAGIGQPYQFMQYTQHPAFDAAFRSKITV